MTLLSRLFRTTPADDEAAPSTPADAIPSADAVDAAAAIDAATVTDAAGAAPPAEAAPDGSSSAPAGYVSFLDPPPTPSAPAPPAPAPASDPEPEFVASTPADPEPELVASVAPDAPPFTTLPPVDAPVARRDADPVDVAVVAAADPAAEASGSADDLPT
ncbi:MAG: hypothetical protein AAF772_21470, partial [Acidobacteriota bacterium]